MTPSGIRGSEPWVNARRPCARAYAPHTDYPLVIRRGTYRAAPRTDHRGFCVTKLSHNGRGPAGDITGKILCDMIRELFPGLSTAERCKRAGQLLGLHQRHVRRLEAGETGGRARDFLVLMNRLGAERTLAIIERYSQR
jgi:hypothetical protein